jgi:hypothetical protein
MKKVTHLVCIDKVTGFTVDKKYKMLENGANIVTVINDFGNYATFNKVEGEKDFKNFFIMV